MQMEIVEVLQMIDNRNFTDNKLFYERNHINAVHQALKELSKEYGFEYTRKRTYSFD